MKNKLFLQISENVFLAVLYFLTAQIGLMFAIPPGNVTAIWLPSGIILAAVCIRGLYLLPGIFLGAFIGNAWAYFDSSSTEMVLKSLFSGSANGLGDVLCVYIGYWGSKEVIKHGALYRNIKELIRFLFFAVFVGSGISALFGITSLALAGFVDWGNYLFSLITWWTGDSVGILLLTPILTLLYQDRKKKFSMNFEGFAFVSILCLITFFLLDFLRLNQEIELSLFILAPILIWGALRMDKRLGYMGIILVASLAITATVIQVGEFSGKSIEISLVELQLFLSTLAITIYIIYILTDQNKQAKELKFAKEKAEENEMELLKNKLLLNETGHMAKVGGWEIDFFGNTLAWTDETFKIHELSTEDQPNVEEAISYYHTDDQKMVAMEVEDAIQKGKTFDFEARLITARGNQKWVRASGKPVLNDGKAAGIRGSIQDISERKEFEHELIKAKERAEESDHLKTAFLSNMSHEIRTPMNGILGFTELLQSPELNTSDQKEYANIIQKSSERLLDTVNDIVEISKIESGEVGVSESMVDIVQLHNSMLVFFEQECKTKGLQIINESNNIGNKLFINTDATKLNSIISNLIKNAIKYSLNGEIRTGFKISKNELIYFCKDTGIGIPINRQEAIFNRFVQADPEDKNVHEGSGLGLAIVKSYVEMLNGKIWVESKEGVGSSFYVSFPINSEKTEMDSTIEPQLKSASTENINVLIVEDDEINALHLSILSDKLFGSIKTVENGILAIEVIKNDPSIDVILMDMKMPVMNGYEATKKIREFNKDIIIIAQTAYAFDEEKARMLEIGCNGVISKPISKDELLMAINECFHE